MNGENCVWKLQKLKKKFGFQYSKWGLEVIISSLQIFHVHIVKLHRGMPFYISKICVKYLELCEMNHNTLLLFI